MKLREWLAASWYQPLPWLAPRRWLLAPLTALFAWLASRVRARDSQRQQPFSAPVLVIGNLTVGGAGKTPVVIALVEALQRRGLRVGVVSRGYGGSLSASGVPVLLHADHRAAEVGDEPLLIFRRTACPVAIDADRSRAVQALLAAQALDVVLADDGLQHYKMHRDFELAVIDGQRGFGNGKLLPLGPLREPLSRLQQLDWVLVNGETETQYHPGQIVCSLRPQAWRRLFDQARLPLTYFSPDTQVHAVAGIGHPQRFFDSLRQLNLQPIAHPFADHYHYRPQDLQFGDLRPVVMTEKDAVKCVDFTPQAAYVLEVALTLPESLIDDIVAKIAQWRTR